MTISQTPGASRPFGSVRDGGRDAGATILAMRRRTPNFFLLSLLLLGTAAAQSGPRVQISHTTEALRGVSAVSPNVAWASGTHGTYLRTIDGGTLWTPAQVADAATLDFRAVVAFSADEAFLMSAGSGDQSRIYHTSDAGKSWQLQFTNKNPKGFFDSMAFWDSGHGIVLGDPIPDERLEADPAAELTIEEARAAERG